MGLVAYARETSSRRFCFERRKEMSGLTYQQFRKRMAIPDETIDLICKAEDQGLDFKRFLKDALNNVKSRERSGKQVTTSNLERWTKENRARYIGKEVAYGNDLQKGQGVLDQVLP
jgi:hypothetical protein